MKFFRLEDPIYKFNWYVQFGDSVQSAAQRFQEATSCQTWDISNSAHAIFTSANDFWGGLLWFSEANPSPGTIAHEVIHATFHAMRKLEAKIVDEHIEEVFAYYADWLVQHITKRKRK